MSSKRQKQPEKHWQRSSIQVEVAGLTSAHTIMISLYKLANVLTDRGNQQLLDLCQHKSKLDWTLSDR